MYSKILVPLDGSQLAEKAIPHALEIARSQKEAQLVLLRSWELDLLYPVGTDGVTEMEFSEKMRQTIETYLQQQIDSLQGTGLEVVGAAEQGEPAGVILAQARDRDIDIIVMSSHGRSGISRWLLGSVADKVVRHAPCPVLIVGRSSLESKTKTIAKAQAIL